MSDSDNYRKKAVECRQTGARASTDHLRSQWEEIARQYDRLADECERFDRRHDQSVN